MTYNMFSIVLLRRRRVGRTLSAVAESHLPESHYRIRNACLAPEPPIQLTLEVLSDCNTVSPHCIGRRPRPQCLDNITSEARGQQFSPVNGSLVICPIAGRHAQLEGEKGFIFTNETPTTFRQASRTTAGPTQMNPASINDGELKPRSLYTSLATAPILMSAAPCTRRHHTLKNAISTILLVGSTMSAVHQAGLPHVN